jgi:hypothetical protein
MNASDFSGVTGIKAGFRLFIRTERRIGFASSHGCSRWSPQSRRVLIKDQMITRIVNEPGTAGLIQQRDHARLEFLCRLSLRPHGRTKMFCIVVRRGEYQRYDLLYKAFGQTTPVVWERRVREQRRISAAIPSTEERRQSERRGPAPPVLQDMD